MLLQACLNGARARRFHPRLPVTPAAIAEDAAEAVAAGAAELHVHVRDADGRETLAPEWVDATVASLRARLPGTLVGVSTGAWIERDDDRRLAMIASWRALPDHASVNLSEPGAPAVIEALRRRGVAVEAGLATAADAERLVELGLGPSVLRILVEIEEQGEEEAMAAADAILAILSRAGVGKPILLHGVDRMMWPFVERAARERYSTRVGLEDGAMLPDGTTAPSNAALVAAATEYLRKGWSA